MSATLAKRVLDHTMSLLEDILGVQGKNSLRVKLVSTAERRALA